MKERPPYFYIVAVMAAFFAVLATGLGIAAGYGLRTGAGLALVMPAAVVALGSAAACLWSLRVARSALREADPRARRVPPSASGPHPGRPSRNG